MRSECDHFAYSSVDVRVKPGGCFSRDHHQRGARRQHEHSDGFTPTSVRRRTCAPMRYTRLQERWHRSPVAGAYAPHGRWWPRRVRCSMRQPGGVWLPDQPARPTHGSDLAIHVRSPEFARRFSRSALASVRPV